MYSFTTQCTRCGEPIEIDRFEGTEPIFIDRIGYERCKTGEYHFVV